MVARRYIVISSIILIVIIIGTSAIFLVQDNSRTYLPHKGSVAECSIISLDVINAGEIKNLKLGDSLDLNVSLRATEFATIKTITAYIDNGTNTFTETKELEIDIVSNKTTYVSLEFGTGIWNQEELSLLVLDVGNYSLNKLLVIYESCFTVQQSTFLFDLSFQLQNYSPVERFESNSWEIQLNRTSIQELEVSSNRIHVANNESINANFTTKVDFSASMNMNFSYILENGSQGAYQLAFSSINLSLKDYSENATQSIPVTHVTGSNFLLLSLLVPANSSFTVNLSMISQKQIIFTAIAEDNWSSTFRSASFYLQEMSKHFESAFNVTIVPVATVNFLFSGGTNLFNLIDEARLAVGEAFGIQGGIWDMNKGQRRANLGVDILIVLTNRTMSNYGLVPGGKVNVASHAGGSLNANGQRMSSSWGDNLIQHEVSHIFGALDRWTNEAFPSVMTKPATISDLFQDITNRTLWLTLTNWIEDDLIRMSQGFSFYDSFQD